MRALQFNVEQDWMLAPPSLLSHLLMYEALY